MEAQVEKNDEAEKPLLKRRSSILKIPKSRNPFEEIDTTETFTDIKPVRRVSFASSNFVKPFAPDPEQNTIWDNTYEEDVNHTNSTQSSQEQIANSCTKFGSTFLDSTSAKTLSRIVNGTVTSQQDMELTQQTLLLHKENIPIIISSHKKKFSIIDYAKKRSTNTVVPVFDLSLTKNNMEFTCQNLNGFIQVAEEGKMNVTTMNISCQDAMDFTCQVSGNNVIGARKQMVSTCHVSESMKNSTIGDNSQMTFTCQMPEFPVVTSINKIYQEGLMTSDMELSKNNAVLEVTDQAFQNFLPEIDTNKMNNLTTKKYVEATAKTDLSKINETYAEQIFQKNLTKGSGMDMTCQISGAQLSQTHRDKIDSSKTNSKVPFTERTFKKNSSNEGELEMTCQIPQTQTTRDYSKNNPKVTVTEQTLKKKFTIMDEMDVSCDFPTTQELYKTMGNSILTDKICRENLPFSNEMEISCEMSQINSTKKDVQGFTEKIFIDHGEIQSEEQNINAKIDIKKTELCKKSQNRDDDSEIVNGVQEKSVLTAFEEKENIVLPVPNTIPKIVISNECKSISQKHDNFGEKDMSLDVSMNLNQPQPKMSPDMKVSSFLGANWRTPTPQKSKISKTPLSHKKKFSTLLSESDISFPKDNSNVLRTHQDPKQTKTPESFHINLTNITSGVDDTEQLLQCTYSKPNPHLSFMLSRFEKSDTQVLNFEEDTGHITRPNLTNLSNLDDVSPSDFTIDDIQRNKLACINDTYVLRDKKNNPLARLENTDDGTEADVSLGIIPDEVIQVENCHEFAISNYKRSPKKIERKEFHYEIKHTSEISDLLKNIKKQNRHITEYLENFKFREMRIPEEFTVSRNSTVDSSGSIKEDFSDRDTSTTISIEESIRKHHASCRNSWKLEKVDDDMYYFTTLFRTLVFVVRLNLENGMVLDIQNDSNLAENSKPFARYVLTFLMNKLDEGRVRAAIGDHCDILSLLDYVQMNMSHLHSFQGEVMLSDVMRMETDFVMKYKVVSISLLLSFDILVDVRDIENLNCDEDIKIITHTGRVNEHEVKNLAKRCQKGLDFFKEFEQNINEFLKVKEKRKKFGKGH